MSYIPIQSKIKENESLFIASEKTYGTTVNYFKTCPHTDNYSRTFSMNKTKILQIAREKTRN